MTIHGKEVVAEVSTEILRLVAPFMAYDDPRYYLNGIHVRPSPDGGTYVEASNGHFLLVARDEAGSAVEPVCISIIKSDIAASRSAYKFQLAADGFAYMVSKFGMPVWSSPTNRKIDGRYPDFAGVLPKAEDLIEGLMGAFFPHYLSEIVRAANHKGRNASLRFFRHKNDALHGREDINSVPPLVFVIDEKHFGALMPLRVQTPDVVGALLSPYKALPKPAPKATVKGEPIAPMATAETAP